MLQAASWGPSEERGFQRHFTFAVKVPRVEPLPPFFPPQGKKRKVLSSLRLHFLLRKFLSSRSTGRREWDLSTFPLSLTFEGEGNVGSSHQVHVYVKSHSPSHIEKVEVVRGRGGALLWGGGLGPRVGGRRRKGR